MKNTKKMNIFILFLFFQKKKHSEEQEEVKSLLRLFCSVTFYIIVSNLFYSSCYNHIHHLLQISHCHPLMLFLLIILHSYCYCCLEYKYFFLLFCKQLIFASQKLIVCFFSYILYECFSFTIFVSYMVIHR